MDKAQENNKHRGVESVVMRESVYHNVKPGRRKNVKAVIRKQKVFQ